MHFSVITPAEDLLRQAAHELAHSRYAEHQWLWQFFPGSEEQTRDFIFRRHLVEGAPRFYVVSERLPIASTDAWQVQSRPYDPQLLEGQRLSFQLCANPVVSKKNSQGKSQRHDVVMQAKKDLLSGQGADAGAGATWKDWPADHQDGKPLLYELAQTACMEWLESRASKNGFKVIAARVDAYQQHRAGKRDIRFSTVELSGELLVTDPALLRQVLMNGLGHAKVFGCGLLLVKKADTE